jgi:Ca-activated chloride channel family protein
LSLSAWTAARAQEPLPSEVVAEGNRLLEEGKFAEALAAYERAAEARPDAPEVVYNQGVAHYRIGEYEKAADFFRRAMTPGDPALDARSRFNLGNCAYATALQQQLDPQAAIESLEQAIGHYDDALQLTPGDRAARENIERAQRLAEELRELQQQQQQQQQQGDQQNEDQEQQEQPQQDQQQEQDPNQREQEQQGQDQQDPQEEQEQQQSQSQQDEPEQQEQQGEDQQEQQQEPQPSDASEQEDKDEQQPAPQPQQAETKPMSQEEAERLLQAIRDKERQRREKLAERQEKENTVPVRRDW